VLEQPATVISCRRSAKVTLRRGGSATGLTPVNSFETQSYAKARLSRAALFAMTTRCRTLALPRHSMTPSDIKSEWWATSSRIRGRLPPESASWPHLPTPLPDRPERQIAITRASRRSPSKMAGSTDASGRFLLCRRDLEGGIGAAAVKKAMDDTSAFEVSPTICPAFLMPLAAVSEPDGTSSVMYLRHCRETRVGHLRRYPVCTTRPSPGHPFLPLLFSIAYDVSPIRTPPAISLREASGRGDGRKPHGNGPLSGPVAPSLSRPPESALPGLEGGSPF
jgi:hypothetical protein